MILTTNKRTGVWTDPPTRTRGRIRGGDGAGGGSSAKGGEGSERSKHASSASILGSDGEDGGEVEGEEKEEEAPPALPDRELCIPVLPRPPPGADVMISRLPNILGFKTEAFDPETYDEAAVRFGEGLSGWGRGTLWEKVSLLVRFLFFPFFPVSLGVFF